MLLVTILVGLTSSMIVAFTPSSNPSSIAQQQQQNLINEVDDRRAFFSTIIGGTAAATIANIPLIANAEEGTESSSLALFQDTNVGFEMNVPSRWIQTEQKLPDRRRLVLFLNNGEGVTKGSEDVVFVAYTPVRDDFTSLASFGSVDMVGQATILPKGELAGQDTDNQMLTAVSKKNAYYFDYTSKTPDQPKRHFRTIFTMIQGGTGGAGSVLVTITAQTLESRYDAEMESTFDKIIDSYRKI